MQYSGQAWEIRLVEPGTEPAGLPKGLCPSILAWTPLLPPRSLPGRQIQTRNLLSASSCVKAPAVQAWRRPALQLHWGLQAALSSAHMTTLPTHSPRGEPCLVLGKEPWPPAIGRSQGGARVQECRGKLGAGRAEQGPVVGRPLGGAGVQGKGGKGCPCQSLGKGHYRQRGQQE